MILELLLLDREGPAEHHVAPFCPEFSISYNVASDITMSVESAKRLSKSQPLL